MIYILALVAGVLLGVAWWMWQRPAAVPIQVTIEPEEEVEAESPPSPSWQDPFHFAHFNETRRRYAEDIDTEAQRIVAKLATVREAMKDDMAALKRMRDEADAARVEADKMREEKRVCELQMEDHRQRMQAAIEARLLAGERIDELTRLLTERDGELVRNAQEIARLQDELSSAMAAAVVHEQMLAQNGLSLHEAKLNLERLEQAVQARDAEIALQKGQIEALRAETQSQRDQINLLERDLAELMERFNAARLESIAIIGKLREGQEQANERAEKLMVDGDTMRRHIVETERARDKLLGQVGQLRAENAGLRAESQVKLRDLEALNRELAANISILERMLANARTVRAQPAPARAQLRLIAEAKKVPSRASGG